MGIIKCKTCQGKWTVTTTKAETVITQNHTYLNPGHRLVTVWEEQEEPGPSWQFAFSAGT